MPTICLSLQLQATVKLSVDNFKHVAFVPFPDMSKSEPQDCRKKVIVKMSKVFMSNIGANGLQAAKAMSSHCIARCMNVQRDLKYKMPGIVFACCSV